MSSSIKPVALILGAGKNVGVSVGRAFADEGYRVAYVARGLKDDFSKDHEISIHCDLFKPETVAEVFEKTIAHIGIPTVVIYNAYWSKVTSSQDPMELSLDDFQQSLAINVESLFVTAKESLQAWKSLPKSASPTLIYTGNGLIHKPYRQFLDIGAGKAASANIIQLLAAENESKGYKFYYADQRAANGDYAWSSVDGIAHAKLYLELALSPEQRPWEQTFVKGKGYTTFENPQFADQPPDS